MSTFMTRRQWLRLTAFSAAAVPLASLLRSRAAMSAEAPLIATSDPAAAAVQYVEDASQAKAAKKGAVCSNCALYQGSGGAAQGPCVLFAGKQVKAGGWCAAWVAKA